MKSRAIQKIERTIEKQNGATPKTRNGSMPPDAAVEGNLNGEFRSFPADDSL
ncbi:hypothetical protein RBWH47_04850 [Rhodopirellula baltica WH47]|uniref:Uncharacterized protein n=2 Tax=Rhodopirellula baltica TaxID=265606 RepID=F2AQ40_RHOBT|nr:hypothetical protein RBWH47_04850 [Rhodopirellula baltica WH47]ELP35101.1 hypothetical protein RBSWK_01101 [Rhodopirellula baltica SWK14]